jgi:hypothetical protein
LLLLLLGSSRDEDGLGFIEELELALAWYAGVSGKG